MNYIIKSGILASLMTSCGSKPQQVHHNVYNPAQTKNWYVAPKDGTIVETLPCDTFVKKQMFSDTVEISKNKIAEIIKF